MKKRFIIILFLLLSAVYPVYSTFAVDSNTYTAVAYTVHNFAHDPAGTFGLSNTERQYMASNTDATQVCIFCHTPHNASRSVPLWNRPALDQPAASTYRLYTSSASLSTTAKHAALSATSESLLCLSCHDGKTAMNVLHNSRVSDAIDGNGDKILDMGFGDNLPLSFATISESIPGAYPSNLGALRSANGSVTDAGFGINLTDDHPIGFSYKQVYDESPAKAASLHDLNEAKANKLRFYGPAGDRVECSTCHNPHVYYGYGLNGGNSSELVRIGSTPEQRERRPFLVRGNNGSAMCLGCHKK